MRLDNRDVENALDAEGFLKTKAWLNIAVALLAQHGGSGFVSMPDLMQANCQQVEYEVTEQGIALRIVAPLEGTA